jgi:hypothetical protein
MMFYSAKWVDISNEAVEFVKILIQKDPYKRVSIEEIKRNKWLNY